MSDWDNRCQHCGERPDDHLTVRAEAFADAWAPYKIARSVRLCPTVIYDAVGYRDAERATERSGT
jgi:hypothetical protein